MRKNLLTVFMAALLPAASSGERNELVLGSHQSGVDELFVDWYCECESQVVLYTLIVDGEIVAELPQGGDEWQSASYHVRLEPQTTHTICVRASFAEPEPDVEECWEQTLVWQVPFVMGDVNFNGAIDIGDGIFCLGYLFHASWYVPSRCKDAMDSNDDEGINMADAVFLLQYLFAQGPRIPAPFPECGYDPTGKPGGGPDLPPCTFNERCQ